MNTSQSTCPICEEGNLENFRIEEEKEYRGVSGNVPLEFSECNACGSEQASAHQARTNKRAMLAFKKGVEGLLSSAEIRAFREKYKLSQAQAALVFGGGPVAFSKYESDDVMQSEPMDKLLRMADQFPKVLRTLAIKAGVDVPAVNPKRTQCSVIHLAATQGGVVLGSLTEVVQVSMPTSNNRLGSSATRFERRQRKYPVVTDYSDLAQVY